MTAAAATPERGADAAAGEAPRRLWRPVPTFLAYLLTGGLYGIWWFFVARREMAEELDSKPSAAVSLLEGVLHLVPVVNAYVWYRALTDLNTLRQKVGAPAVSLWGWVAALALSVPCMFLLPEVLGPALDAFNADTREIIRAVGYATFPAQFLVFGYAMGYWNEYWMEKTDERATWRRLGPVDLVLIALAVAGLAALIAAAAGAL